MMRAAVRVGAVICGVVIATAGIVRIAGLDDDARELLRFTFAGPDASSLQLAAHNARLVAAALLAAAAVPRLGRTRVAVDSVLAAVLVINAAAIGVAIGAYGARAAQALALHAPLELAAMALAGGALVVAHRGPLPAAALLGVGAAGAALLVIAGVLEASVQIGGLG